MADATLCESLHEGYLGYSDSSYDMHRGSVSVRGSPQSGVDVVVVHPMQTEDGHPLEPRIRQLHLIPFSRVPIPF